MKLHDYTDNENIRLLSVTHCSTDIYIYFILYLIFLTSLCVSLRVIIYVCVLNSVLNTSSIIYLLEL
jgi:hypothetical protein